MVPLLALIARLGTARPVSILPLCLKGSPSSLNNSKDDVRVTPHCLTWLMRSSTWSPGSATPITSPLGPRYWELAKSYLSKAETQQKNRTGGEKAKASASTILFCQLSIQADTWWPSTFVVELHNGDPNPGGERESSSLLLPLVCQGPKRPGTRMRKTPTGLYWSVFCDSARITDLLVTAKVHPRLNGVQINIHLNNTYALAKE